MDKDDNSSGFVNPACNHIFIAKCTEHVRPLRGRIAESVYFYIHVNPLGSNLMCQMNST